MNGHIDASQLIRRAFVYVRQSSMAQVIHHQESTMTDFGATRSVWSQTR